MLTLNFWALYIYFEKGLKHAFPILMGDLEKDDWGESTHYVVQLVVHDHYDN